MAAIDIPKKMFGKGLQNADHLFVGKGLQNLDHMSPLDVRETTGMMDKKGKQKRLNALISNGGFLGL